MKNNIPILLSTLALLLPILYCCEEQEPEAVVTSVTLNQTNADMVIGETLNLAASIAPPDIKGIIILWETSLASVASVNQEGLVEALSEGVAIISATAGTKKDSCIITVTRGFVEVESIELDKTSLSMVEGEEIILNATVSPDDATEQAIEWKSSDTALATVDNNGTVKALSQGNVTITARAGNKYAKCQISITVKTIAIEEIRLSKDELSMVVGEEATLSATIIPENATVQTIERWSSSDQNIATVDHGIIKAIKEGEAVITAYADGKSAQCKVFVDYLAVQSILLDTASLSLYEGEEHILSVVIEPENATYKDVEWTSSNMEVATVRSGKVTAVKKGRATITAKAGEMQAECAVDVLTSVAQISLDKKLLEMTIGESEKLSVSIIPEDATLKEKLTWSSSNSNIATVDSEGRITAIKEGDAIVSVSLEGKKDECHVVVDYIHVESIALDRSSVSMNIGEELSLYASLSPDNATYQNITWSSSNNKVATISSTGVVKAIGAGRATITAESDCLSAQCEITVVIPVESVTISPNAISVQKGSSCVLYASVQPYNATDRTIVWTSSDDSVATVSQDGNVTAIDGGKAIITASCGGKSATCEITVTVPVTGISLDISELTLNKGERATLTAMIEPSDATDKDITWESSDASVATVVDGVVTAVSAGFATITAKVGTRRARCRVSVVGIQYVHIMYDNDYVSTIDLHPFETRQLSVHYQPEGIAYDEISWYSSDTDVVTVSNSGLVTAINAGSAIITVTVDGITDTCFLTVTIPVTGISLDKSELTLNKGESETIKASIEPANASNQTITWISSYPSIATVEGGVIKALSAGATTIKARIEDKEATCLVIVVIPVTSVTLSITSIKIRQDQSYKLSVAVAPDDATYDEVVWQSSSPNIATVSADGLVMGVGEGEAMITASVGGKSATCIVVVSNSISGGHEGTEYENWN